MSGDTGDKNPTGQYDRSLVSKEMAGESNIAYARLDPALARGKHIPITDTVETSTEAKRLDTALTRDKYQAPQQSAAQHLVTKQLDPALTREKHIRPADKVGTTAIAKRFDSGLTGDKRQAPQQSAAQHLVTEQLDPALTREKHRPSPSARQAMNSLANLVKGESAAGMRPSHTGISGGEHVNHANDLVPPSTPNDAARTDKANAKGAPSNGR